jgi:rhodanese-related sulfurtransferase
MVKNDPDAELARLRRIEDAAHVLVDLWEESKWLGARVPEEPVAVALDKLAEALVEPEDRPK